MAITTQDYAARIRELLASEEEDMSIEEPQNISMAEFAPDYSLNNLTYEEISFRANELSTSLVVKPQKRPMESTVEELFHDTLTQYFEHYGFNQDTCLQSHARLVLNYVAIMDNHMQETNVLKKRQMIGLSDLSGIASGSPAEAKAERDTWGLLQLLSEGDVLGELNYEESASNLEAALGALPVGASIADYMTTATTVDQRYRKLVALVQWLESAAVDDIVNIPVSEHAPWADTLHLLKVKRPTAVQSLHPDAQLTADGCLLPLAGIDKADQEALYTHILQLLRAGQQQKAWEVARDHKTFWLAATLLGVHTHQFYPIEAVSDPESVPTVHAECSIRLGNLNQPLFLRTCYRYASHLASQPENFTVSTLPQRDSSFAASSSRSLLGEGSRRAVAGRMGALELTLHGVLSNHVSALLRSPLLPTWQDKVWIYLRALVARDSTRIAHQYRMRKLNQSQLFAGCDQRTVQLEEEVLAALDKELEGIGSLEALLRAHPPPSSAASPSLVTLLYQLQGAIMLGKRGIQEHLHRVVLPLLEKEENGDRADGLGAQYWRIVTHLLLWLRSSPEDSASQLSGIVNTDMLHRTIVVYIRHLTNLRAYGQVALYAVYLPRLMRIAAYSKVLYHIQQHRPVGSMEVYEDSDSVVALTAAERFFPEDILDIQRTVLELTAVQAPGDDAASQEKGQFSADQLQQLEALRWFSMHAETVNEGVRQVNRFISAQLAGNNLSSVDIAEVVLTDYLPSEIVAQGYELLCGQKRDLLESIRTKLYTMHIDTMSISAEVSAVDKRDVEIANTQIFQFTMDVAKLCMWRRLVCIMRDLSSYQTGYAGYERDKATFLGPESLQVAALGRYLSALPLQARKILQDIHQFFTTNPLRDTDMVPEEASLDVPGYSTFFSQAEDYNIKSVELVLGDVEAILANMQTQAEGQGEEKKEVAEGASVRQEAIGLLQSQKEVCQKSSDLQTAFSRVLEAAKATPENDEDKWVHLLSLAKQTAGWLQDVEYDRKLQNSILFCLVKVYVEVCMGMADMQEQIDRSAARGWLKEVVDLSVLLASSDFSLQLYHKLNQDQLKQVLQSLQLAGLRYMDLQGDKNSGAWL